MSLQVIPKQASTAGADIRACFKIDSKLKCATRRKNCAKVFFFLFSFVIFLRGDILFCSLRVLSRYPKTFFSLTSVSL